MPRTAVTEISATTPLDLARGYHARGWQPLAIPYGTKAPTTSGWQRQRLTTEALPHHFNGQPLNIGILLGEPSGGLVDVDLDSPEALALADEFLPPTSARFGRPGRPNSHRLYRSPGTTRTTKFEVPDGTTLVEIRSTGAQTVFPGSTHPTGERIAWVVDGEPAEIDAATLHRAVSYLAAAALFAQSWPGQGSRHEASLAASGLLLRGGLDVETVTRIVTHAARVAGDEEWQQRACDVESTARRIAAGEDATGGPRLAELLTGNGQKIVERISKWLRLCGWVGVPSVNVAHTAQDRPTLTDAGNAQRFAAQHGANVRYVPAWKSWIVWNGRRWERDDLGRVMELAKATSRSIYEEAGDAPSEDVRRTTAAWAVKSESEPSLRRMLGLAQSIPGIAAAPSHFDRDPLLLNCPNGTLDLRTGELRSHGREDMLTKMTAAPYEPEARHDVWERFITEALPDVGDRGFAQRYAGSCLTGEQRDEVLVFSYGPAGAGKTTLTEALKMTMGDYAVVLDFSVLLAKKPDEGPREHIARLAGVRLAIAEETADGAKLATAALKYYTGGSTMSGHFKYGHVFEFRPTHKLWLASNFLPGANADDDGFWRRLRQLTFPTARLRPEERDPAIKATLTDPAQAGSAVLSWAVAGCMQWQQIGLADSPGVLAASAAYRRSQEPLAEFVAQRCSLHPDARARGQELRDEYEHWARERGVKTIVGREWTEALERLGCQREHTPTGAIWKRIAVSPSITSTPRPRAAA